MATKAITKAQASAAVAAVNLCGGNLTAAAKRLKLPRSTVYSRVIIAKRDYAIEPEPAAEPSEPSRRPPAPGCGLDADALRLFNAAVAEANHPGAVAPGLPHPVPADTAADRGEPDKPP